MGLYGQVSNLPIRQPTLSFPKKCPVHAPAVIWEMRREAEIAVARIIVEPNQPRVEFAIVVADRYQGKGLGTRLIDMLIGVADEKALESIYGIIMPDNKAMLRLCEKLGFTMRRTPDGIRAELKLR